MTSLQDIQLKRIDLHTNFTLYRPPSLDSCLQSRWHSTKTWKGRNHNEIQMLKAPSITLHTPSEAVSSVNRHLYPTSCPEGEGSKPPPPWHYYYSKEHDHREGFIAWTTYLLQCQSVCLLSHAHVIHYNGFASFNDSPHQINPDCITCFLTPETMIPSTSNHYKDTCTRTRSFCTLLHPNTRLILIAIHHWRSTSILFCSLCQLPFF